MPVDVPRIVARAARTELAPAVVGFVERSPALSKMGPCLELPFSVPVVHLPIEPGDLPIRFSCGSTRPAQVGGDGSGAMFVIALGMSGAAALFADELRAATGRFLPAEGSFWSTLQARISEARSFEARVQIAEFALGRRLEEAGRTGSPALMAADAIMQDRWCGRVSTLADAFGVGERTLRNRFKGEIGWSPKALLRVSRFNRVLRAIHPRPWSGQPTGDVRLEFADDAHFHREFIALAGISPRAFVRAKQASGDAMLHNVTLESFTEASGPT